jgi:hypothetical protein
MNGLDSHSGSKLESNFITDLVEIADFQDVTIETSTPNVALKPLFSNFTKRPA